MHSRWGPHYIGAITLVGSAIVSGALWTISTDPGDFSWVFLALLTLIAGSFPIKIPGVPALIYVSEAFVFTIVLLYGAAPAVLTFSLNGLFVTLCRKKREAFRVAFNMAEPAISISAAAMVLQWLGVSAGAPGHLDTLVLPLAAMTSAYFLLNSWLNAFAVSAETGTPAHHVWRQHFLLLSLNCFAGASVALVLANTPRVGAGVLGIVIPLLIVVYVAFRAAMGRVADSNAHLKELNELYLSTLETLALAIDAKDQITHGHIRRVQKLAVGLARKVGITDSKHIQALEAAALLHDMGKIAVPEHILNKPGKLTPAEYDRMKLHASVGGEILSSIRFPYPIAPIVRHHHENWDGSGYPDGLAGTDIPLGARIMSVVDCYDALTSDRPYRPALPAEEALDIVVSQKGAMYDPLVVDTFVRVHQELSSEASRHRETSTLSALIRQSYSEPSVPVAPPSRYQQDVVKDLLAFCDAAVEIGGHASAADVAQTLGRRIKALLPSECVVFYLTEPNGEQLVAAHVSGPLEQHFAGVRVTVGEGLSGWVAAQRRPIIASNPTLDFAGCQCDELNGLRSAVAAPLVADGELLGVLTLYAVSPGTFGQEHLGIAEFAARQAAAAIARARRFDADRAADLFDAATGLPNEKHLRHLISLQALADGRLLAGAGLIWARLEGGGDLPAAADDRVATLAAAVKTALRATDLLFRTGAHDLKVLMADTTPHGLERVVDRIGAAAREAFPPESGTSVDVGYVLVRDAEPGDDLLEAAGRSTRPAPALAAGRPPVRPVIHHSRSFVVQQATR